MYIIKCFIKHFFSCPKKSGNTQEKDLGSGLLNSCPRGYYFLQNNQARVSAPLIFGSPLCFSLNQTAESSDEEMLHIDTESKPEVKGSSLKVKKKDHSAAGILDLLQASKQVGGIDYSTNR